MCTALFLFKGYHTATTCQAKENSVKIVKISEATVKK